MIGWYELIRKIKTVTLFFWVVFLLLPSRSFGQDNWFEHGFSALKSGHYQKAIEAFSKAIEINPSDIRAYNSRGIAWFQK
ncbi:MAG: tetratricopeptide repeat protein, partial [Proteobacteria bacterium]|nr:tetratricopeptide repeat protein [Pseudomonadota bacterium]